MPLPPPPLSSHPNNSVNNIIMNWLSILALLTELKALVKKKEKKKKRTIVLRIICDSH